MLLKGCRVRTSGEVQITQTHLAPIIHHLVFHHLKQWACLLIVVTHNSVNLPILPTYTASIRTEKCTHTINLTDKCVCTWSRWRMHTTKTATWHGAKGTLPNCTHPYLWHQPIVNHCSLINALCLMYIATFKRVKGTLYKVINANWEEAQNFLVHISLCWILSLFAWNEYEKKGYAYFLQNAFKHEKLTFLEFCIAKCCLIYTIVNDRH